MTFEFMIESCIKKSAFWLVRTAETEQFFVLGTPFGGGELNNLLLQMRD